MFGDDVADDGQAQACAAFARRKIRRKDALAVGGRNAGAGVGHCDFNRILLQDFARGERQGFFFEREFAFGNRVQSIVN